MHATRMYVTIFPSMKLDCYFNDKRDKVAFLVIDDADNSKRGRCVAHIHFFRYLSEYNKIHKSKKQSEK